MFKQSVCDIVSLKLILCSSKHSLNRVIHRSVLRYSKGQHLSFLKEILDALLFMYTGIVKEKYQPFTNSLPLFIIELLEFLLQINQEHQPFSGTIGAHSHLAEIYSLICQGTNCRGGTSVWELINWIVASFLCPRVKLNRSWVEGSFIDPDESAPQVDESLKEFLEDCSVFKNILSIPISCHSLGSDERHIQFVLQD